MAKRIRLSRAKGWRKPAGAVVVARPSPWGNPWTIAGARAAGFTGTDAELAALCVAFFRRGEAGGLPALNGMQGRIHELRGKDLACWCRLEQPCHADVLLELANAPLRCEAADG
jgi:hypothetical protein